MANNNPWLYAGLASSFPNISRAEDNKTRICLTTPDPWDESQTQPPQPCKTFTKPSDPYTTTLTSTPIKEATQNSLMVFRYKERIYAIESGCPHQGYPLTKASLSDIEDFGIVLSTGITCPKHGWTFDLHTGEADLAYVFKSEANSSTSVRKSSIALPSLLDRSSCSSSHLTPALSLYTWIQDLLP
ncbi:hypothetical protein E4T48_06492 [Aureobasidium sp. EXF-10727]|nr:hypothetical protein E4T48_06492 [Aureobasidium sp. EXF-10727]